MYPSQTSVSITRTQLRTKKRSWRQFLVKVMKTIKILNFRTVFILTNNNNNKVVRTDKKVGSKDKKGFIQLNGPSSAYKSSGRIFKAVVLSMYGSAYSYHFGKPTRNERMKQFITSKVKSKINGNAYHSPCIK